MRYLVTGGMGFIGSALVHRLLQDGHGVRTLDDGSRGRASRLDDVWADVETLTGDVRDPAAVDSACRGVDAICHLAAINGTEFFYTMPERVLDVGLRGILNVVDSAIRHSVERVFFASSSEVYQTPSRVPTPEDVALTIPDPLNPRYSYAGSKLASELLVLNYGRSHLARVVVFRPHNVYGPDMGWEHVIPQLAMRARDAARPGADVLRLSIQGTGEETRAFCYVDDAVDGIVTVIERGDHRGIYNVGADVETRIVDLARAIGRRYAHQVEVVPGPAPGGGTPRRCPDISRLRALGFEPRVALQEGLEATIRWYEEHAAERPPGASLASAR